MSHISYIPKPNYALRSLLAVVFVSFVGLLGFYGLNGGFFPNREFPIFIQETVENQIPSVCKAGYNAGTQIFDTLSVRQAATSGFNSSLSIITDADQLPQTVTYIQLANQFGVEPVIRMCFDSSDPNHCSDFKTAEGTINFLNQVNASINPGDTYVFEAGPNEPITEKWLNKSAPSDESYFVNDVAPYTRDIALAFRGNDQVRIITSAFNLHACHLTGPLIPKFFEALGPDGRSAIEGMAGNSYDPTASDCYNGLRTSVLNQYPGQLLQDPNFKYYQTEFGTLSQSFDVEALKSAYERIAIHGEVQTIMFFTPFATGNPDPRFEKHRMSGATISQITGCNISGDGPILQPTFVPGPQQPGDQNIPTATPDPVDGNFPAVDRPDKEIETIKVPKARYYSDNFVSHELQSCEEVNDSKNNLSGWLSFKQESNPNELIAYQAFAAQVFDYPEINVLGSGRSLIEEDSEQLRNYGTEISPYEPLCARLTRSIESPNLLTSIEHAGKLSFYDSEGEDLLSYGLPKLGSAIACLNLLCEDTGSCPDIVTTGNLADDYPGFNTLSNFNTIAYQNSQENIIRKAQLNETEYESFLNLVSRGIYNFQRNIESRTEFIRDPLPREPHREYEEVDYCSVEDRSTNYKGPELNYINILANEPTESVSGFEELYIHEIKFNIENYCATGDGDGDGESDTVRGVDCETRTLGVDAAIFKDFDIEYAGVPGGLAAFGKIYEYLEEKSLIHTIDSYPVGTRFRTNVKLIDMNLTNPVDIERYLLDEDSYDDQTELINVQFPNGLTSEIQSRIIDSSEYEFIMPVEFSRFMIALSYQYSNIAEREQYFVETNFNLFGIEE